MRIDTSSPHQDSTARQYGSLGVPVAPVEQPLAADDYSTMINDYEPMLDKDDPFMTPGDHSLHTAGDYHDVNEEPEIGSDDEEAYRRLSDDGMSSTTMLQHT
jgi:hypothetical protein